MTPLAYFEEDLENPSILASHDGVNWVVPNGLRNPIDRVAGGVYHSDIDLIIHDGVMYCFYRLTYGGTTVPRFRTSTDGVHWSPLTVIDTVDGSSWTSLSIVHHGGMWHSFYLDKDQDGIRTIGHRTALRPEGPWGNHQAAPILGMPPSRSIWHLDVVRHRGRWLAAISDTLGVYTGDRGRLLLATSADGLNWQVSAYAMDMAPEGAWDDQALYRPSFYVDDMTQNAILYYGGIGKQRPGDPGQKWQIGLAHPIPLKRWPEPPQLAP